MYKRQILLGAGYFAVFAVLVHKGRSKDGVLSGSVGCGVQAFAYVATYISAVALVGFGGLAHAYGLQMLLVAAGQMCIRDRTSPLLVLRTGRMPNLPDSTACRMPVCCSSESAGGVTLSLIHI